MQKLSYLILILLLLPLGVLARDYELANESLSIPDRERYEVLPSGKLGTTCPNGHCVFTLDICRPDVSVNRNFQMLYFEESGRQIDVLDRIEEISFAYTENIDYGNGTVEEQTRTGNINTLISRLGTLNVEECITTHTYFTLRKGMSVDLVPYYDNTLYDRYALFTASDDASLMAYMAWDVSTGIVGPGDIPITAGAMASASFLTGLGTTNSSYRSDGLDINGSSNYYFSNNLTGLKIDEGLQFSTNFWSNNSFTFSTFLYPTNFDLTNPMYLLFLADNFPNVLIRVLVNNSFIFSTRNTASNEHVINLGLADDVFPLNVWIHTAITMRGLQNGDVYEMRFYINGIVEYAQNMSGFSGGNVFANGFNDCDLSNGGCYFFEGIGSSVGFPGGSDDTRLYNRELQPEEILNIYQSTTTPPVFLFFENQIMSINASVGDTQYIDIPYFQESNASVTITRNDTTATNIFFVGDNQTLNMSYTPTVNETRIVQLLLNDTTNGLTDTMDIYLTGIPIQTNVTDGGSVVNVNIDLTEIEAQGAFLTVLIILFLFVGLYFLGKYFNIPVFSFLACALGVWYSADLMFTMQPKPLFILFAAFFLMGFIKEAYEL